MPPLTRVKRPSGFALRCETQDEVLHSRPDAVSKAHQLRQTSPKASKRNRGHMRQTEELAARSRVIQSVFKGLLLRRRARRMCHDLILRQQRPPIPSDRPPHLSDAWPISEAWFTINSAFSSRLAQHVARPPHGSPLECRLDPGGRRPRHSARQPHRTATSFP